MTTIKTGALELPTIRKEVYFMSTIYERNFERLVKLGVIVDGKVLNNHRSKVDGIMDLVVESRIALDGFNDQPCIGLSLAHYFKQNGDLCSDPFIEILVYPSMKMVEVFSFEMSIPPMFDQVYPSPGRVYPKLKKDLNDFLSSWLVNLLNQGHGEVWTTDSM